MDILSASSENSTINWYENTDGTGNFGAGQIITRFAGANPQSVLAADLDGDGDVDVLSSSWDRLVWSENTDDKGHFGRANVISRERGSPALFSADVPGAHGDDSQRKCRARQLDDQVFPRFADGQNRLLWWRVDLIPFRSTGPKWMRMASVVVTSKLPAATRSVETRCRAPNSAS